MYIISFKNPENWDNQKSGKGHGKTCSTVLKYYKNANFDGFLTMVLLVFVTKFDF